MSIKPTLITRLREMNALYEHLIRNHSLKQAVLRGSPEQWAVKDVLAHLRAWQQVSIARLEAALQGGEPSYPDWLDGTDPFEAEERVEECNDRIYRLSQEKPWPAIQSEWRQGFQRFIDLAEAVPDKELADNEKYPWLRGYALADVVEGSIAHHEEHLQDLNVRTGSAAI